MHPIKSRLHRLERRVRRMHGVLWVLMDEETPELREPYVIQHAGETIEQAYARHVDHYPDDADRIPLAVFGFEAVALERGG